MPTRPLPILLLLFVAACASVAPPPPPTPAAPNALEHEVVLGERAGFVASLVLDLGPDTPLWTVASTKVFPSYGCDEVLGLDDKGHLHVLESYSGRWTPHSTIADPAWLGGFAQGDVDARVPGPEVYVAGKSGNVYEVVAHRSGVVDNRWIGNLEGREVHTLVAADVAPDHPGAELLAFTNPGALFVGAPRADADGFAFQKLADLPGRVRDAVVLPREANGPVEIATAARSGRIELFRFTNGTLQHVLIHGAPMGAGRIALRPEVAGQPLVLYSTRDDGSIWRHARRAADDWGNEAIYLGPQGPRGIAAGRFDRDAAIETVLVCGYSGKVELLRRDAAGWRAETVFEDRDKCHWIARAELDGRNTTDEAVVTGYGGRIVLLSRPPGYGLPGVLAAPAERR
jgi:hypothetical protein